MEENKMSKKEFIKTYEDGALVKSIRVAAILCYVCAGITAAAAVFSNFYGLIDACLLLGLALGMHIGKSKVCAILILILSVFEVVFAIIVTHTFSGWLWVVAGILAVSAFSKADKEYKKYTSEQ